MEKTRNTKTLQYITIVLLIMNAIVTPPYDWMGRTISEQVAFFILAVAMVLAKPSIMVFASIIAIIVPFRNLVTILIDIHSIEDTAYLLAGPIIPFIYWILIIIGTSKRKKGKAPFILATVVYAVMALFSITLVILVTVDLDRMTGATLGRFFDAFFYLGLRCSATVLLGSFLKKGISPVFIPTAKPSSNNVSKQYDKLSQLKELLDAGTITQEEFDEKKKQILGL